MNFFETVAGHRLADCLTRSLPKIAESLDSKQYTVECNDSEEAIDVVAKKVKEGDEYVSRIETSERVLLIFKKCA